MPMPIPTEAVRQALVCTLGSEVVQQTRLADTAASLLRAYSPYRATLMKLNEGLCNRLFNDLYALLGPRMTVRLDNGQLRRIPLQALPEIADDVMGVLFDAMTITPDHQQALTEYAMHQTSLAAMRVLLLKYGAGMAEMEKDILRRIIRDNYPPEKYASWLP